MMKTQLQKNRQPVPPEKAKAFPERRVLAYRPDVDGLRALAVVSVILVHGFPSLMQNGYIGVDIFFVISGFLITRILITQMRDNSFSLSDFYIRRANRIFPPLIFVLAASLGFGWIALYASEFKLLGRSAAAGAGFVANINFYLEGGYWDISAKLKPLLHLWSLGVEEQYYLFWPVLLWAAWKRRFNIAIVLALLICASLAWNLYSIGVNQSAAFYLPFARFWEILTGGAVAYAARPGIRSEILSNACAVVGFGAIAATLAQSYPPEEFPGWRALLPVIGTALIIAAGPRAILNSWILSRRWIVYIGLISFPLYLWHWPLLTFARILENGELSSTSRIVALFLTVAFAVATYHLVEKPIRSNTNSRGLVAISLAVLLALCGAAGYFVYAKDGIETRYNSLTKVAAQRPPPAIDTTPMAAFLGDSQAGNLALYLPLRPYHMTTFSTGGWPFLLGTDVRPGRFQGPPPGTPKLTESTLDSIISERAIDLVVIAHMNVLYTGQEMLQSYPQPMPGETSASVYENGLRRTVKLLTDAGKKVVYVKSIPFLSNVSSVMACSSAALPIKRKQPKDCLLPVNEIQASRQEYYRLIDRAFEGLPNVWVFDPLPFLCDDRFCYVERDGIVLYGNMSHLSPTGSYLVGAGLLDFLISNGIRAARNGK